MIKATDLMIGDLVKCTDPRCEGHQVDLIDLFNEKVGLDGERIVDLKNIIPIPLTPEILEKNGFGFIDTSNNEYSSVWTGWWILDGLELGCCDNSKFPVFFNIADTNVKVNYVHELQHALRLCGIEKEIELGVR